MLIDVPLVFETLPASNPIASAAGAINIPQAALRLQEDLAAVLMQFEGAHFSLAPRL
jgi:hypothetical protein